MDHKVLNHEKASPTDASRVNYSRFYETSQPSLTHSLFAICSVSYHVNNYIVYHILLPMSASEVKPVVLGQNVMALGGSVAAPPIAKKLFIETHPAVIVKDKSIHSEHGVIHYPF